MHKSRKNKGRDLRTWLEARRLVWDMENVNPLVKHIIKARRKARKAKKS